MSRLIFATFRWTLLGVALAWAMSPIVAQESAAERGKKTLETKAFVPSPWSRETYSKLEKFALSQSGNEKLSGPAAIVRQYGLHPAPYANNDIPMGLRRSSSLLGTSVVPDCMICHGGSILGKSYIGLGNATLDIHLLFEDLNRLAGVGRALPFTFSNARGTSEAGAFAVFLWSFRNPDLSLNLKRHQFDLKDDLCEDVPAWWLLKKKKTMYYTGSSDARSVRSIMQFMLSPTHGLKKFEADEAAFRDIQAYILSIEAPKYPFPIDAALAKKGHGVFSNHCQKCHGTYSPDSPSYPNKVIPLDVIGTDVKRFFGVAPAVGMLYNDSWFAKETGDGYKVRDTDGYQAPPLDGVWATAPYLHNGSVPTLYGVLNSKARPTRFTRSFGTGERDYDKANVGWKTTDVPPNAPLPSSGVDRRKIYDAALPGRSNSGHTFGDNLSEEDRRAIIEYLKSL